MRILDARVHVVMDVVFALAFAFAPLVLGLGGSPAAISFLAALAFVLLAATVWWSVRRRSAAVSIVHGLLELAIAIFLAALPLLDGYSPGSPARRFFWTMAVALGIVWLLTAYGHEVRRPALRRTPGEPVSGS